MKIQKLSSLLLLPVLLGVSLQSFADDQVTFFISSPYKITSTDGQLTQAAPSKLQFGPWTNVYKDGDTIPSTNPQTQTGTINLQGTGVAPECTATWVHTFSMKSSHDKQDRFLLTVTDGPCAAATGYMNVAKSTSVTKSGKTVYLCLADPYKKGEYNC